MALVDQSGALLSKNKGRRNKIVVLNFNADPKRYGYWITSGTELFLFGKLLVSNCQNYIFHGTHIIQKTWEETRRWCLELGMRPISLLTEAKVNLFKSWSSIRFSKSIPGNI